MEIDGKTSKPYYGARNIYSDPQHPGDFMVEIRDYGAYFAGSAMDLQATGLVNTYVHGYPALLRFSQHSATWREARLDVIVADRFVVRVYCDYEAQVTNYWNW